jgi:hypothetical protein
VITEKELEKQLCLMAVEMFHIDTTKIIYADIIKRYTKAIIDKIREGSVELTDDTTVYTTKGKYNICSGAKIITL